MDHAITAVAEQFFQKQDEMRGGPAEELCAPDYRAHIGNQPPMDLAGHQQFALALYGAFPDLRHAIEEVVGGSRSAAVRFRITGTHRDAFMGVPASARSVDVGGIAMLGFTDAGHIRTLHGQFDQLSLMQQVGALG